jgi:hypothetical protein
MANNLRQWVRQRAKTRCEYCRFHEDHLPFWSFHMDHVVAQQHGGKTSFGNLAWSCHRCNLLKGTNLAGVDPDSEKIVRFYNPRSDGWNDYFNIRSRRIVGSTANGRATVWLLQMNSEDRVALRKLLMGDGIW